MNPIASTLWLGGGADRPCTCGSFSFVGFRQIIDLTGLPRKLEEEYPTLVLISFFSRDVMKLEG